MREVNCDIRSACRRTYDSAAFPEMFAQLRAKIVHPSPSRNVLVSARRLSCVLCHCFVFLFRDRFSCGSTRSVRCAHRPLAQHCGFVSAPPCVSTFSASASAMDGDDDDSGSSASVDYLAGVAVPSPELAVVPSVERAAEKAADQAASRVPSKYGAPSHRSAEQHLALCGKDAGGKGQEAVAWRSGVDAESCG